MSPASEELADRIREVIWRRTGVTEKKMFGGVCYLLNGNMVVGSMKSGEMLMRVGPDLHAEALQRPGTTAMVQAGREMVGFVIVANDEIEDDDALKDAIDFAWTFAKTLPTKADKPASKAAATKAAARR